MIVQSRNEELYEAFNDTSALPSLALRQAGELHDLLAQTDDVRSELLGRVRAVLSEES